MTKKISRIFISLFLLFLLGICGYMLIEDMTFTDAFYMTVIAVSTTGLYAGRNLTEPGKYFTIVLIILGIVIFVQSINIFVGVLMSDYFDKVIRKRRLYNMIKELSNHIIICGCGDLGHEIAQEFIKKNEKFVIIDIDKNKRDKLDEIMNCECLFIEGDAADDDILIKAGISKAKCLLSAMNDDAQNTFTVLSARGLNSKIKIVSRCVSPNSRAKLLRAGADKIILPNFIGAKRMAAIALRPEAADFVDTLLYDDHNAGIRIETVKIPAQSILIGKSLKEIKLPTRAGVIVVAVKSFATGEFIFNPAHNTLIQENDLLVILGPDKKIKLIFELIDINDFDKFDKKYSEKI